MTEQECAVCYRPLPPMDLIRVWDRAQPWRQRFVCRPTLRGGFCFRAGTRPAAVEAIEPARLTDTQGA
jgi:hypothetical protein